MNYKELREKAAALRAEAEELERQARALQAKGRVLYPTPGEKDTNESIFNIIDTKFATNDAPAVERPTRKPYESVFDSANERADRLLEHATGASKAGRGGALLAAAMELLASREMHIGTWRENETSIRGAPSFDDIVENPLKCRVPHAKVLIYYMHFHVVRVTRDNLTTFMQYVGRMPGLVQLMYVFTLCCEREQYAYVLRSPAFMDWARRNAHLIESLGDG